MSEELAPYMGAETRAWLGGRRLNLRPAAAQSLALIIHELATNAAKHGALSGCEGRVHVDWRQQDDDIVLRWREEGGPPATPPSHRGLGSAVVGRAASQLQGAVIYDWAPVGLSFEFRGPAEHIVRTE